MTGFNTVYSSDNKAQLDNDLSSFAQQGNVVVTSLDEQPAIGIFAASIDQDPTVTTGFTMQRATVTDATLQSVAQQLGSQGVVITAASNAASSGIDLVGYSWAGDGSTNYDTLTALTTYETLGQQAMNLAASGYIITAVGTADGNQVVLVGTRVHGDSLPRPIEVGSFNSSAGTGITPGMVVVGMTFGNDAGNNPNLPATQTALSQ